MSVLDRFLDLEHAFDSDISLLLVALVGGVLALSLPAIVLVCRGRAADDKLRIELWQRWRSWVFISPCIVVPILAGPGWTVVAVAVLSLLCYAEFARATGLFREKLLSLLVVLSVLALNFAALDNWYGLFVALFPLTVGVLAVGTIVQDSPKGYLQRTALAILGYALFGAGLAHLAFFSNEPGYRPVLLLLFFAVELNDIFAFCVGKTLGRHKLAPQTSPGKTIEGSLGALVLTTGVVVGFGRVLFAGTAMESWPMLVVLGLMISGLGQLGDLTLSSIKRDLGIKDMSATIPGHGGILDRFNSMLLVAPAVFHLLNYVLPGIGQAQAQRLMTGAG